MDKTQSRKRHRSADPPYCFQSKIYIDQHFADSRDEKKMKNIHGKEQSHFYK